MAQVHSTPERVTVYSLCDERDGVVRYIGQTVRELRSRLSSHMRQARSTPQRHLSAWLLKVSATGGAVRIVPLIEDAQWDADEIRLIAQYRADGFNLVNATAGGEGAYGAAHFSGRAGLKKPVGFGAKISAAKTGLPGTPWTAARRAMQSAIKKGVPLAPGHAQKIADSLTGRSLSPAHRQHLSAAKCGAPLKLTDEQDQRRRANAAASSARPDVRAKRSATMKQTLARKKANAIHA